jgi:DNA-binding response OmpR family regulator
MAMEKDLTTRALARRQNNMHHRLLVADDDAAIRRLTAQVLVGRGYQVDMAEDGAVALDALKRNYYDLLITDYDMPKLSGIELLENLLLAHIGIPVILVSGTMPADELNRHPWLQIEATLIKPYTIAEFLGAVESVLADAHGPQEQKQTAGCQTSAARRRLACREEKQMGKLMAEAWNMRQSW